MLVLGRNKMRKIILVTLMLLIAASGGRRASAQTLLQSTTRVFVAFAFETVTVSTVAIGFTAGTIAPSTNTALRAELAEYSLEGCQIRYRIGATSPTATVGTLLTTGTGRMYGWDNISNIKFIRDTSCSADATLSVHYYR
jgi:hypothetical protein